MPDTPTPVLAYDGHIGELYRIFLVNLLLTIATLGMWRFWAVTRMRRYLWSRTSSGGERFEYDGTGAQLFVGFLLGLLVIFGLGIAAALLSALLRPDDRTLLRLPRRGCCRHQRTRHSASGRHRRDRSVAVLRQADRKAGSDGVPAFLSDHPSLGTRVERLGAVKGGGSAMGAADWEAVRMMCGP